MRLTPCGESATATSPLTAWSLLVSSMLAWGVGRSTFDGAGTHRVYATPPLFMLYPVILFFNASCLSSSMAVSIILLWFLHIHIPPSTFDCSTSYPPPLLFSPTIFGRLSPPCGLNHRQMLLYSRFRPSLPRNQTTNN